MNSSRLTINGVAIPNSMLAPGSYTVEPTRRVLQSYFTQDGVLHEDLSRRTRAVVTFSLREHMEAEHAAFRAPFLVLHQAPVTYYDDSAGTTRAMVCKITLGKSSHDALLGSRVLYGEQTVRLEEY